MNHKLPLLPLAALAALSTVSPAAGQVPTFEEVTGHQFGARVTQHHQMVDYLRRLAEASPRVQTWELGRSWEQREFVVAAVTSPANHARLEAIQEHSRRLSDARSTTTEQAWDIIQGQPVIVWFGGSIHGFELSGAEGALKLLEHLTTRDDRATLEVLENVVVLIDPILNPDGRDAFTHVVHENLGMHPQSDPRDWSNSFTGWQGTKFRTGHYFFDTNRDWFAHTQVETRARLPWMHLWRPQVAVDMHEMGSGTEFYFDPPGRPYNPNFPRFARTWFVRFGDAYAAAFDSAGFEYMTGERYNYFYPGYTSNRGYHGAVSMLFEQGSSRGLALERPDGTVRTLADALEQQYVGAWTAVRLAATQRIELLTDYYESQRAILEIASGQPVRYLITNEGDPVLVRELVDLLRRNNAEVSVLEADVQLSDVSDRDATPLGRQTFAAGTYVVEAAQPAGRLIRTLLDPLTP
ncbi:MAG: M14 family zinc carboxypeptidase, partial [Gemmatimonadales bacterium]